MSILILAVCLAIGLGLAVLILGRLGVGTERYTISTRELPNIVAHLGENDRQRAHR
jgi:hypothetical protein